MSRCGYIAIKMAAFKVRQRHIDRHGLRAHPVVETAHAFPVRGAVADVIHTHALLDALAGWTHENLDDAITFDIGVLRGHILPFERDGDDDTLGSPADTLCLSPRRFVPAF